MFSVFHKFSLALIQSILKHVKYPSVFIGKRYLFWFSLQLSIWPADSSARHYIEQWELGDELFCCWCWRCCCGRGERLSSTLAAPCCCCGGILSTIILRQVKVLPPSPDDPVTLLLPAALADVWVCVTEGSWLSLVYMSAVIIEKHYHFIIRPVKHWI